MEIRREAKYTKLAKKVIKETPKLAYIKESGVRIAFLACDVEKKKGGSIVYGDCKKVDPRYKWCCPFDFLITIYEPNVALFDRQQIEILLRHEMRHIGINPDGININKGVGSTCINSLVSMMKKERFDIGFAFDGDADRLIAVSSDGEVVDGDFILALTAKFLKDKGKLPGNTLVTTVMANLGLDIAMRNNDIKVLKTKVGDRFVLEEMLKGGYVVGGEQSGHIILTEFSTTGDGLLTACNLLRIMRETGSSLKELSSIMYKLPQVLVNIKVKNKDYASVPAITDSIKEADSVLSGRGRILVRPSGTENLIRVMAEGPDEAEIKKLVEGVANVVAKHLC